MFSIAASRSLNLATFSRAVSLVAMPAMAALLIVAGIQSIKREEVLDVWDIGWGPRLVMLVTFVLTLTLPVQYAVLAGVVAAPQVAVGSYTVRSIALIEAVFVVDDDASVRKSLARLLRAYGYAVETCASAMEFLARAPEDRPACLVLDVRGDRGVDVVVGGRGEGHGGQGGRNGKLVAAQRVVFEGDADIAGVCLGHLVEHFGQPGAIGAFEITENGDGHGRIGRSLDGGLAQVDRDDRIDADQLNALLVFVGDQQDIFPGSGLNAVVAWIDRHGPFQFPS